MANDMVVMARNPQELQAAQKKLIAWANSKIKETQEILADSEENLETAKKNKWRTNTWRRRIKRDREQVAYYEKINAALAAGYCIVPDFPIDIFAVRTTRPFPKKNCTDGTYRGGLWLVDQETNAPPKGEGDYVGPRADHYTWTSKELNQNDKEITRYHREATKFQLPDFPIKLVQPHILKDTSRAAALKIFDEIGILPARAGTGDPMVVGQTERSMSFIITWWVDLRDM